MNERTKERGWALRKQPWGGPWRAHKDARRAPLRRPRPWRPPSDLARVRRHWGSHRSLRGNRRTCLGSPTPNSVARDSAQASPRASVSSGGRAERHNQRARARRPGEMGGPRRKTAPKENRVHQGSPWVTPEGWPSDGRRARAGWGHIRSRLYGQLVGAACTPGRPACREGSAGLT